jgi:hypothetical protein
MIVPHPPIEDQVLENGEFILEVKTPYLGTPFVIDIEIIRVLIEGLLVLAYVVTVFHSRDEPVTVEEFYRSLQLPPPPASPPDVLVKDSFVDGIAIVIVGIVKEPPA